MFHSVELRAYCHATEDEGRVERALRTLAPDGAVAREALEGHHGNPLLLMTVRLEKEGPVREFWHRVKASGALPGILGDIDGRVGEDAVLHVRFDKQRAFEGALEVVRHDDAVAVRAKVAVHPAKRATAVRAVRDYLSKV